MAKKEERKRMLRCHACGKMFELKSDTQDCALCPPCSKEADKSRDAKK